MSTIKEFLGRFALAIHVLRGRPLMYRIRLTRGIMIDGGTPPHALVVECEVRNEADTQQQCVMTGNVWR